MMSFWERSFFSNVDFAICGAGFVGLYAALYLKKKFPKSRILVLERSSFSEGASSKNAGFGCFGSPSEILMDFQTKGEDATLSLIQQRKEGLEKALQILKGYDVGLEKDGGYEVLTADQHISQETLAYLNKKLLPLFQEPAVFKDRSAQLEPLGLRHFSQLIFNEFELKLHPVKVLAALQHLCQVNHIQILYGAHVTECLEDRVQVKLSHQDEILELNPRKTIITTNAWLDQLGFDEPFSWGRGQVYLYNSMSPVPFRGCFHYDRGYVYFRDVSPNQFLIGGFRNAFLKEESTREQGCTKEIQTCIENFLDQHIHLDVELEQSWSGMMAFNPSGLPVLKEKGNRIYCGISNGMGVALSASLGQQVADKVD